ncbi:formate-dependent phosphoribosylglycinamide formyltransferase [Bifidobacterium sp. ESL0784]|uniref:formate-dependent phosphoribosylglycinamide formyltransferase n=1 Tax=Bifidobacterium sp. ESL0784 TaxID=2983231 RepID=UPI0023F7B067|nr:formate-dependent phosphoribosylglycinamide formyltransferase [Bifidobacterium sp. ESL0784]MDF7641046.1 formate-dependent phosphoribosylglycinamide formyltransferase [Bifidobacterium sp. ESL0784]
MTAEAASSFVNYPLGNPAESHQTRVLLLGSGELGREIAIELTRLGAFVIAADSYEHAPAMQIAQESHILDMTDAIALNRLISATKPSIIVPEIEAIATTELAKASSNGIQVVPSSQIAAICMNREALRTLMHETLGLPTTPYRFAGSFDEFKDGANAVGYPCVVKPVMSSSGHGQSVLRGDADLEPAWQKAQTGRRDAKDGGISRVIVEALAPLDYELTMLTVSSSAGIVICSPIGQRQEDGDYRESWQPAQVDPIVLERAEDIARKAVSGLADMAHQNHEHGWGVFGVELFVLKNGEVLFNEVSPRPHDTGMVTMISQRLSEFALHARAVLGIPVTEKSVALSLKNGEVAASHAIVVTRNGQVTFTNVPRALSQPDTGLRIFGKPEVHGHRRMAVALAIGKDETEARSKTTNVTDALDITVTPAE